MRIVHRLCAAMAILAFVWAMGIGVRMAWGEECSHDKVERWEFMKLQKRVDNLETTSCTWTWPFEQPDELFRRLVVISGGWK